MSTIKNPDSEIANLETVDHDSKTNESIDQPSADDNTITKMDAKQTNVEENLLFLDHDKTNIVPDKTDQKVKSSTLIDPTSKLVLEASQVEEEKHENKLDIADEHNENEDSDGSLKLPVIVSVKDTHNETSTSIEQVPPVTDITEKLDRDVENNVNSELSQISSTQIKVEESPATVKQDAPQKMDEPPQVFSVQESIQEIIEPVKEGANESRVSYTKEENKKPSTMDVNTESEEICHANINKNVDVPTEIVWESPTKEQAQAPEKMDEYNISIHETQNQAQNETSKVSKNNDEPMELESDLVQESFQGNLKCSENVEQIPGDPKNISSNLKDVTNTQFETEVEKDSSDNVHLESSKTAQEMKNIEKMDEDVKKDHAVSMNPQESVGGSPTTKDDKEVQASNNKDGNVAYPESTQIHALIAVQECPVQPKHETMGDIPNIPMEPSEIVMEQDNLEETLKSQPGDKIEDTITRNKIISQNDSVEPTTGIKVEVIDIIEPSEIATTPQNISKSAVTVQAQELTNVIQCKEEPVPIQYTTKRPIPQETQIKAEKYTEDLPCNTNIHSPWKVAPIYDNNECTPGKRARLEPSCSAVLVKTENDVKPTNELAKSSENASVDVIEIWSPVSSDSQVETAPGPASNRSQSPCSSIVEEIIDLDADEEVLPLYETKVHGDIDVAEFVKWCYDHKICYTFNDNLKIDLRMNLSHLKPFKFAAKYNKSVLTLGHIPKSLNETDVHQLIKKYTQHAGEEIANNITYIHLDKTSNSFFNTAYVKWRDNQKYLTIKALEIMRRADLKLEGNNVPVKYDDRMTVEWDENEKPISKKMFDDPDRNIHQNVTNTRNTDPPCAPFRKGEIDYNDKDMYGLSNEFLLRHNIRAPLTSNVIVKNVVKNLKEGYIYKVFGMAGNILSLILEPDEACQSLRIQYDHPIEAVQAISMFDKKSIYGQTVSVFMDNSGKIGTVSPEECLQIGPGLGADGSPLKSVRCQIELGILRAIMNKEISKLKFKITSTRTKINDALNTQTKINNNLKKNLAACPKPFQQTAQNSPTLQNPQNAITSLSTAIRSSVQNNLLGMLGLQPNLLQGLVCLNQNNVAPNWSAPNPELHCWSQPNAQPSFSPNMEPVTNIQSPGIMQNSPVVQVPTQPTPIQPIDVNMQQAYTQPGFSNIQPLNTPSAQYAQSGLINQAAVITTHKNPVLYSDISKPRHDIPPVVAQPQKRGLIQTYPNVTQSKPVPPEPVVKSFVRFPVAKPQIRGPVVSADHAFPSPKTAPVAKPPKPVPIKFKIPYHVPASVYGELESVPPPVSDARKRDKLPSSSYVGKQPAYQKVSPLPKGKPLVKDQPWINMNVKATRRPSKSPERPSRARSPRYDTSRGPSERPTISDLGTGGPRRISVGGNREAIYSAESRATAGLSATRRTSISPERSRARSSRYDTSKEDRRCTDSDYSRERECDYRREREREYSRERREEKDAEREKELERDHRRPATVIFKYLPSSVSSDDLHEKMREIGKLVSAQVNGNGHAVVTFKYMRDAETCIEMFNKSKVDDTTIEVKWAK